MMILIEAQTGKERFHRRPAVSQPFDFQLKLRTSRLGPASLHTDKPACKRPGGKKPGEECASLIRGNWISVVTSRLRIYLTDCTEESLSHLREPWSAPGMSRYFWDGPKRSAGARSPLAPWTPVFIDGLTR